MLRSIIVILALILNLIVFGFYGLQGIYDYHRYYEAYQNLSFFKHMFWVLLMALIAVFSVIGFFKKRWPAILSCLVAICFYGVFAYYLIGSYFDALEKERTGGLMPMVIISIGLLLLNLGALIYLIKIRPRISKNMDR